MFIQTAVAKTEQTKKRNRGGGRKSGRKRQRQEEMDEWKLKW